jgi:hypothetical protein
MAVPALVQAEHLRELPAPRPVRPLGTEQVVVRGPWPEISAEVDREHAIRTGVAEDRRLVRPAVGWMLLGIPIGIVVVTSAIAVILAVYGTLVWGALLAGLYGGAIAGAYFGGVAGLGTALLREEHAGRRVTEVDENAIERSDEPYPDRRDGIREPGLVELFSSASSSSDR